jgi:uncharacterized protein (UPF0276 family)
MLTLATPISHLLKDENAAIPVTELTDCYEVRDHTMKSNLPNQFLYHCDLQPIHILPEEEFIHLQKVSEAKKDLKLVTFHCASCCDKPVLKGKCWIPGGTTYTREELLQNSINNFKRIREIFGPNVIIAIENNNYYKTAAYDIVCEPAFITEVVIKNDLRMLVDLAHAQISAFNMGIPFKEYLYALPLERVIQIHLCEPGVDESGDMFDAHKLPSDFELSLVEELKNKYQPEYLTLEYYKSIPEIVDYLKKLKEFIK